MYTQSTWNADIKAPIYDNEQTQTYVPIFAQLNNGPMLTTQWSSHFNSVNGQNNQLYQPNLTNQQLNDGQIVQTQQSETRGGEVYVGALLCCALVCALLAGICYLAFKSL